MQAYQDVLTTAGASTLTGAVQLGGDLDVPGVVNLKYCWST